MDNITEGPSFSTVNMESIESCYNENRTSSTLTPKIEIKDLKSIQEEVTFFSDLYELQKKDKITFNKVHNSVLHSIQEYASYFVDKCLEDAAYTPLSNLKYSNGLTPEKNCISEDILKDAVQCKSSGMAYLCKKVQKYVMDVLLLELVLLYDYEMSPLPLSKEIKEFSLHSASEIKKYSNINHSIINYLKQRDREEEFIPPYNYSSKKSTVDKIHASFHSAAEMYSLPSEVYDDFSSLDKYVYHFPYSRNNHVGEALDSFITNNSKCFSPEYFIKNELAFLYLSNPDYKAWIPPSFFPYTGWLFQYSKNENFLFRVCDKYKKQRISGKNHDKGREFNQITSAYERLCKEKDSLLLNLERADSVTMETNRFLFTHLLHQDFFSSLDSDIFESLSKSCDVKLLLNHKPITGQSQITVSEQRSIFCYELLKLMMIFDINLNRLQPIGITGDNSQNCFNSFCSSFQLIHDFLYETLAHLGEYLNDAISLLWGNLKSPNFWIKNRTFLNDIGHSISSYCPEKPDGHKLYLNYDDNQKFLIIELLRYASHTGLLFAF